MGGELWRYLDQFALLVEYEQGVSRPVSAASETDGRCM